MSALGDFVSRYHLLLEQNGFGDAAWAEELQQRMLKHRLTDAGRLLSSVLRPHFISQTQLELLENTATQLSSIFDRLQSVILGNQSLLNRLRMLPAEKSLLAVEPGYKQFSLVGSMDTSFAQSICVVSGVDTCRPVGLAYANALADVFLDSPLVNEFRRGGQKISKAKGVRRISQAVAGAWRDFGGKGKPAVAVVDWAHVNSDGVSEGELLADVLSAQGVNARFVPPEKLIFSGGELAAGASRIDVVVRRILARELVTRWDLSHPLFEAYRSHSVCVVNSFRSEIGQRRAFLELLSDDSVTARLSTSDRKLLKQTVRWTRVVSARKVERDGQEVDLLDWVIKNRERLMLLPDQAAPELRTFAGSEMSGLAWEWALKQALRSPYVVQECGQSVAEKFPFFHYGEFKMRDVEVTLQAQLLSGELGDCLAVLQGKAAGGVTPLGIAAVLVVA